jgi:16S rRNA (uracil1498-N3)-methyltransferase
VLPTVGFGEMLALAANAKTVLFCYEGDGTQPLGTLLSSLPREQTESIAIVIGSEGGFSLAEAQAAKERGFYMAGLGPRILRTETASGFALACISCMLELGGLS